MKVFKIILILVLLFSVNFGVLGNSDSYLSPNTLKIAGWRTLEIRPGDLMNYDPDYTYWRSYRSYEDKDDDSLPDTLLEWFKNLTLDEKVEMYNHWQKKATHYIMYQRK